MTLPLPLSKNQLLAAVDNLPYTARLNYAARLGRDHRANRDLRELVNDLFQHPDPPVPEMEAEEGFTEILPSQRTSISKYYNEDQLGLAISASAGFFDVIKARLTSPSTFFDNFVYSNYVRMKEENMAVELGGPKGDVTYKASDEEIVKAILEFVPARSRLLIQECIQAKRLSVIERVVPALIALPNYPYSKVAHIIHACSPDTVKEFLRKHMFQQVGQVWNKLIKLHISSVLDVLEEILSQTKPLDVATTWSIYTSWAFSSTRAKARLDKNNAALVRILDLALKYPPLHFNPDTVTTTPVVKPGHNYITMPSLISGDIRPFARASKEKVTKLLISTIALKFDGTVIVESSSIEYIITKSNHLSYDNINQFIKAVLTTVKPNRPFWRTGGDYNLLSTFSSRGWPVHWNGHQVIAVSKLLFDYLNLFDINEHTKNDWHGVIYKLCEITMAHFNSITGGLYAQAKNKAEAKLLPKLRKKLEKNRKYTKDAFQLYWPSQKAYFDYQTILKTYPPDFAEIRRANLIIDAHVSLLLKEDIESITATVEGAKPELLYLIKSKRADKTHRRTDISKIISFFHKIVNKLNEVIANPIIKEDSALAQKQIEQVFLFIKSNIYNEIKEQDIANYFIDWNANLTYEHFFPILKEDLVKNITLVMGSLFMKFSTEHRLEIYKLLSQDTLVHIVQNRPDIFTAILKALPQEIINEIVVHLLGTPKLLDENTRNTVISYQNIKDNTVRTSLQKMSNSSNVVERSGALKSLIIATARSGDKGQLNKTLKFIREKIKNESQENRAEILSLIFTEGTVLLKPEFLQEEQRQYWFDMQSDAFESQDLDENVYDKSTFYNHPVLQHFLSLGNMVIDSCITELAAKFDPALFDFGAEILWKLHVFRHGEKKAAAEFRIPFQSFNFNIKPEGIEDITPFVEKIYKSYIAAYEKRIAEKNADWKDNNEYMMPFFDLAVDKWWTVPEFASTVHNQVERIKAESKKDDDGLYLIKKELNSFRIIADTVLGDSKKYGVPQVQEVLDLVMHSRLASAFVSKWVEWKEIGCEKPRDFKAKRDQYIPELLKITPSAIHLRFVWRHLVTYMQNKLDDFIGKRKTFRGVFYVGPDQRKFDRSCLKTPQTRQSGGRARAKPAGKSRKATKAGVINDKSGIDPEQVVEEEREKEKEIANELEGVPHDERDHEDFFYLEACYGLRRLLPRQVNILAKDWQVQLLSGDRSIPYKVKATARWTIMPTVTYNDIVVYMNENETATDKHKGLPVNIIEALLRGVMRNDEPTAPLNFLLSPKFLGSDRSRVSVYAISQSVPYMPADGLTNMLKLCLTGKRRFSLKVSAYKEIIRLLASQPSEAHMNIILKEWKRTDLHRDIRLAIVHTAFEFLESKSEKFHSAGWYILEDAAKMEDQHEILTAILGVQRKQYPFAVFSMGIDSYLRNKRIGELIEEMSKHSVEEGHAARFGEKVVAVAARTANNDDVRFIATSTLFRWPAHDVAIELSLKYLKDFSEETLLFSKIPAERSLFSRRWQNLQGLFVDRCAINASFFEPNHILDLASAVRQRILSLSGEHRQQKKILLNSFETFLQKIPVGENLPYSHTYPEGFEGKLVASFQGVVLPELLFSRRQVAIFRRGALNLDTLKLTLAFLHDLTVYCSKYPASAEGYYMRIFSEIMTNRNLNSFTILLSILDLTVDATNSPISKTSEYLYSLRAAALQSLNSNLHFAATYPDQTMEFWEKKLFDFAAERKDIPREHVGESSVFSFSALSESIKKVLNAGREVRSYKVYYSNGTTKIITSFADRYIKFLEGKSGDGFSQFLSDNFSSLLLPFIVEALDIGVTGKIAHLLLSTNPKLAHSVIPKVNGVLASSYKSEIARAFAWDVISLSLVKGDKSAQYKKFSLASGLNMLSTSREVCWKQPEDTIKFIDQILSDIPSFVDPENLYPDAKGVIDLLLIVVNNISTDHKKGLTDNGTKLLNKFVSKYVVQPRKGDSNYGPEQECVRQIAHSFINNHAGSVVDNSELVTKVIHTLFIETSAKENDKATTIKMVQNFINKIRENLGNGEQFVAIVNQITNLSLAQGDKHKKYIEASFDVALAIYQNCPWLLLKNTEEALKFVNWAISMFIHEPDVMVVINNLKKFLTNTNMVVYSWNNLPVEKQAARVAKIISTFIDLKHQKSVVPQQTLLPLQAYTQYAHCNYYLGFAMVKQFGPYFQINEEHKTVWRKEFEDLLDRFTKVDDPEINRSAWDVDTVNNK